MTEMLISVSLSFWTTLCLMAPYLLLGFLVAGMLSVFLSPETVERHLGGRGMWPVVKASLFGMPLPLCSCGVLPVSAGLRRHGASRGATVAFLISTPQTGLDNILVVYGLLGPVFAIFSPIAAFITGLVGGGLTELGDPVEKEAGVSTAKCQDACCALNPHQGRLHRALHYGFVTIARDLAKPLLIGIAIAAALTVLIPGDFFKGALGTGIVGILLMMLVGVPIYVCSVASVPIAAALILKGVSPGAALAFLITGPATNAAAVATVWKVLGRRTAFIYLGSIAGSALALGLLLNGIYALLGPISLPTALGASLRAEEVGGFHIVAAVALLGVLAASFHEYKPPEKEPALGAMGEEALHFRIAGMTCAHCVETIRAALIALPGVTAAEVDLNTGAASIAGIGLDADAAIVAVRNAGFQATVRESPHA